MLGGSDRRTPYRQSALSRHAARPSSSQGSERPPSRLKGAHETAEHPTRCVGQLEHGFPEQVQICTRSITVLPGTGVHLCPTCSCGHPSRFSPERAASHAADGHGRARGRVNPPRHGQNRLDLPSGRFLLSFKIPPLSVAFNLNGISRFQPIDEPASWAHPENRLFWGWRQGPKR